MMTEEEYIEAKKEIVEYEKINSIKEDIFPYNIAVGDTIGYICNGSADSDIGRLISIVVTEELLENILKYETTENYHQFRIIKKYDEK